MELAGPGSYSVEFKERPEGARSGRPEGRWFWSFQEGLLRLTIITRLTQLDLLVEVLSLSTVSNLSIAKTLFSAHYLVRLKYFLDTALYWRVPRLRFRWCRTAWRLHWTCASPYVLHTHTLAYACHQGYSEKGAGGKKPLHQLKNRRHIGRKKLVS